MPFGPLTTRFLNGDLIDLGHDAESNTANAATYEQVIFNNKPITFLLKLISFSISLVNKICEHHVEKAQLFGEISLQKLNKVVFANTI